MFLVITHDEPITLTYNCGHGKIIYQGDLHTGDSPIIITWKLPVYTESQVSWTQTSHKVT